MVIGTTLLPRMLFVTALGFAMFHAKRVAGFGVESIVNTRVNFKFPFATRQPRGYLCNSFRTFHFSNVNGRSTIIGDIWRLRASVAPSTMVNTLGRQDNFSSDAQSNDELLPNEDLLPGTMDGFSIVKIYKTDQDSDFDMDQAQTVVDSVDVSRLELTPQNISVPVALMMLDPEEYPSKSRARKACRKANIMIHRGPLDTDKETGEEKFDAGKCIRARVGCRIFPGDVLCKQVRIGDGKVPRMSHEKPPFELPVIFQDDHFAIVDKPAGVVVYGKKGGGDGFMTIRSAIPFAVTPSKAGTYSTLRRPQPVHRLDKPTSGLLIIAKTKPAMVNLSYQFRDRKIKKTYTAVINGIPREPLENKVSSKEAHLLGVDVDPDSNVKGGWQVIDHELDEKSAVTVWKAVKYSNSINANDNVLTTVELKPKTGRFHQLRRHLSWVCECPIVGDHEYDGGSSAMALRGEGLFLCSNKVTLEHPFYNDLKEDGKAILQRLPEKDREQFWLSSEGKVMVTASIDLPEKFNSYVCEENSRFAELISSA